MEMTNPTPDELKKVPTEQLEKELADRQEAKDREEYWRNVDWDNYMEETFGSSLSGSPVCESRAFRACIT